jgi:hypothetical protein
MPAAKPSPVFKSGVRIHDYSSVEARPSRNHLRRSRSSGAADRMRPASRLDLVEAGAAQGGFRAV